MNNDWILIADDLRDLASLGAPFRMMTTRDYVLQPKLLSGARPKIINLARNYNYQTDGYYASLLGEARGHRVVPTVETMLDLYDRCQAALVSAGVSAPTQAQIVAEMLARMAPIREAVADFRAIHHDYEEALP